MAAEKQVFSFIEIALEAVALPVGVGASLFHDIPKIIEIYSHCDGAIYLLRVNEGKTMCQLSDALWLNVSPALRGFDRPLLKQLSRHVSIARWEYSQTQDEALSLDVALVLLHDYLKHHQGQVHLLGHGTSGLLAWLYARRHPERVRSLTLLSVGVHPAADWQAHYYAQLQELPCSRDILLKQTVYNLFGYQSSPITRELQQVLERDLKSSLSPHTLYQRVSFFPGGVTVPLLICGSALDEVVDDNLLQGWQPWLKQGDRLWRCPTGRYFFHFFQPQIVGQQIINFWSSHRSQVADSQPLDSDTNLICESHQSW